MLWSGSSLSCYDRVCFATVVRATARGVCDQFLRAGRFIGGYSDLRQPVRAGQSVFVEYPDLTAIAHFPRLQTHRVSERSQHNTQRPAGEPAQDQSFPICGDNGRRHYRLCDVCRRREEHGFSDIPTSIYWVIVTMTTVDYDGKPLSVKPWRQL